jgi:hypothetical protein
MVGVTYYDLRHVTASLLIIPIDYWLTASSDGGETFTEETKLGTFDMKIAPHIQGYFVGDYQGLAADGDAFRPFFAMTTGMAVNATDVYVGDVTP